MPGGRSPKKGLDFSRWDVQIFEGDKKIDKLIDAQGWTGFSIYFWLCQKAYALEGYYLEWSYDDAATTARRMAGGIRSETVKATVGTCARVGLFDKRLLDDEGILTSRGIQRRYVESIQKRTARTVYRRYWLLDAAETAAGHVTFFKNDRPDVGDSIAVYHSFLPENTDYLPGNHPSREENRIVSTTTSAPEGGGGESRSSREGSTAASATGGAPHLQPDQTDPELGKLLSFYMDRINPAPSSEMIEELKRYRHSLSPAVIMHAMSLALDERKTAWSYIRAILRRYQRDGLRDMEAVLADQRRHEESREHARRQGQGGNRRGASAPPSPPDPAEQSARLDAMRRMSQHMKNRLAGTGGSGTSGTNEAGGTGGKNGGKTE